jgi:hypothetical protein
MEPFIIDVGIVYRYFLSCIQSVYQSPQDYSGQINKP